MKGPELGKLLFLIGAVMSAFGCNASVTPTLRSDASLPLSPDFSNTPSLIPVSSDTPPSIAFKSATSRAVTWLMRAQDALPSGCVNYWFDIGLNSWRPENYFEVTGYTISTLYDVAATTTDPTLAADLRNRAQRMANCELRNQLSNGAWPGAWPATTPYVFDAGQIIEGLVRASQETGNTSYKTAAIRAGDWVVSVQGVDGSWGNTYSARVARNLLQLWNMTGDSKYLHAAVKDLDWVVSQQQPNGWFRNAGIHSPSENNRPLTHAIGYVMEGLLDSGTMLNNLTYVTAAQKAADALLAEQREDGSLSAGSYLADWTPANTSQCLTGSAQTALVWLKLYQHTKNQGSPDSRYLNAAAKMNEYLVGVQGSAKIPEIDGGLPGSDPIDGSYQPGRMLSWATKFLVDDLNLQTKLVQNATVSF